MYYKLLFLLLFVLPFDSLSQNLSIDELIKLRKNDIGYVEEYLTGKGWSFLEASEPSSETLGSATFAYKKNNYDETAQSFINFLYSDFGRRRIGIQVNKVESYNAYVTRIKALGCKLVDSKIKDGEIIKIYMGPTTTFKISTSTVKNDFDSRKTIYYVFIIDNDDYQLNFSE